MLTKKLTCLLMIASLLIIPAYGFAEGVEYEERDIKGGQMAVDAIIVRPLGLVATVLGSAFFIVSLPFSALGGNTQEAYERLIEDPAKFTFKRPLGEF